MCWQKESAERIGIDGRLTYQPTGGEKEKSDKAMPTHTEAIQYVIDAPDERRDRCCQEPG